MTAAALTTGPVATGTPADLALLLEALGRDPDERMSVCFMDGRAFRARLTTVGEAGQVAAPYANGDCWFGTQVLHPRVQSGRGDSVDVIGVRDLVADLDVKPGGLPDWETAAKVIADLSRILGAHPSAVVSSGHGLQPHWAIERGDDTDWPDEHDPRHQYAAVLWRRWGRLVYNVATRRGGKTDSVFDLARVMRTPGTVNRKDPAAPVRVNVMFPGGAPVSLSRIAEACDEFGIDELPEDSEQLGEVVAAHGDWTFADKTCGYVAALLSPASDSPLDQPGGWAVDTPTARHPWLVGQFTRLAAAHRLGCITEPDHQRGVTILSTRFRELLKTGVVRSEQEDEIALALAWGIARVERFSEERTRADLGSKEHPHLHAEQIPQLPGFWQARPVLQHVHTYARARRCSPWSVLGIVLARVVTATPPDIVLPPLVGAEASLNLFVAATGLSGGGKGASEAAAAGAVDVGAIDSFGVGSGEGIGHLYAHREKGHVVRDRVAVLFTVAEVDNLTALGQRQGATLLPQLRSAWSGEKLGFSYADPKKALPIEPHSYRMGLVLGVQPGRAAPLLEDSDGGTPQRFIWMPTTDAEAPDVPPDCPAPWTWKPPGVRHANIRGLTVLPVTQVAREAVDAAAVSKLRGNGDPLDGHRLLARLKVAAALGLLDERLEVTDEDWQLAGQVMAVSDATRGRVVAHLAETQAKANEYRGESEGVRAVVVAEKLEVAKVKRVSRSVMRALGRAGGSLTQRDVAAALTSDARAVLPEALAGLVEAGVVEADHSTGKPLFRLANGVPE